jgi:hypothetical protein
MIDYQHDGFDEADDDGVVDIIQMNYFPSIFTQLE